MFRPGRFLPYPGPSGLLLPTLLRRVPILLLAALLTVTLAACGGDSGVTEQPPNEESTVGTSTVSTPAQDTSAGGTELTTQEYTQALEEAFSGREQEIEEAAEDLLGGTLFTSEEVERISSLETAESWSEEDTEFASKFAETTLRATTSFYDDALGILKGSLDEMSGLRPPENLSDLHNNLVASLGEVLRFTQEQVEIVKDADTDIRNREDLANFYTIINSLESGLADPDQAEEAETLAEQAEEACRELQEQLESELERDVSICG